MHARYRERHLLCECALTFNEPHPELPRTLIGEAADTVAILERPVRAWAIDDNRSWNELYAVRAFLAHNHTCRIVTFNDYLGRIERPLVEATYPALLQNLGGALWFGVLGRPQAC